MSKKKQLSSLFFSSLTLGLLSSSAILASPLSDQRVLANRLAYLSVNRVGCEDFSSYFKTDLEPVL
jgi:hypothetical protein